MKCRTIREVPNKLPENVNLEVKPIMLLLTLHCTGNPRAYGAKPGLKEELRSETVTGVYNGTVWRNISAFISAFSFNYGRLSQAFVCEMSNLCSERLSKSSEIKLVPCQPHLAPWAVYFNDGNVTLNSNPNSIITRGRRSHPFQLWHNKIWAGLKPGQGGCVQFVLALVLRIWSAWLAVECLK